LDYYSTTILVINPHALSTEYHSFFTEHAFIKQEQRLRGIFVADKITSSEGNFPVEIKKVKKLLCKHDCIRFLTFFYDKYN